MRQINSSLDGTFRYVAQLADHLLEMLEKRRIGIPLKHESAAEPSPCKIEDVVDQGGHAPSALMDLFADRLRLFIRLSTKDDVVACVNRGERVAEIVGENSDELLAQLGGFLRVQQSSVLLCRARLRIQMEGDQLGKVLEHADDFGPVQPCRVRIDCAQCAKEGAVRKNDWHRDVALKPIRSRRMMIAEILVLGDVIDNDGSAAIANLVADRRLNVELAARQQSEGNFVTHGASDPAIPRDSPHGRKTHSRGAADDFENGRNGVDPRNCGYVGRQGRIEV